MFLFDFEVYTYCYTYTLGCWLWWLLCSFYSVGFLSLCCMFWHLFGGVRLSKGAYLCTSMYFMEKIAARYWYGLMETNLFRNKIKSKGSKLNSWTRNGFHFIILNIVIVRNQIYLVLCIGMKFSSVEHSDIVMRQ